MHEAEKFELEKFEKLFKELFKPLCAFTYKYLKDTDLCKEIVHDVFVNLWEKRAQIDLSKSVKSYLYSSVTNRSLNYLRDNKKFVKTEDFSIFEQNSCESDDFLAEQDLQAKIHKTLDELPEKCRKVFILNRFEGKKYKEIAQELDISEKTVEAHISKALKALKANLTEYLSILLFLTLKF